MFKKVYSFFADFAIRKWWTFWSNIRHSNAIKENVPLREEDKINTMDDVIRVSNSIYNSFKYREDGADQLWDAIVPPPQNYMNYINGLVEDDCDGFHVTMYHCLRNSGIECYLLSAVGIGTGHCLLVFYLDGGWRVLDYISIYPLHKVLRDAVDEYNKAYERIWEEKILYNALVGYCYNQKKFKGLKIEEVEKENN